MSACPGCNERVFQRHREIGGFVYLECLNCSLVTLRADQIADPSELYAASYFEGGARADYTDYAADEPIHRLNARHRLNLLPSPPGTLLEIGSAAGYLLDEARARGWTAAGVDISPWSLARGKGIFPSVAEAARRHPGGFDAAVALQVLEHVPDVVGLLRSIRACLKPGALFLAETWDRGSVACRLSGRFWQQLSPPSVVHLLDERSFNALLSRAGFAACRWTRSAKLVSAGWVAGLIGSKTGLSPLRRLSRAAWTRRLPLPYLLDDLVLARVRA